MANGYLQLWAPAPRRSSGRRVGARRAPRAGGCQRERSPEWLRTSFMVFSWRSTMRHFLVSRSCRILTSPVPRSFHSFSVVLKRYTLLRLRNGEANHARGQRLWQARRARPRRCARPPAHARKQAHALLVQAVLVLLACLGLDDLQALDDGLEVRRDLGLHVAVLIVAALGVLVLLERSGGLSEAHLWAPRHRWAVAVRGSRRRAPAVWGNGGGVRVWPRRHAGNASPRGGRGWCGLETMAVGRSRALGMLATRNDPLRKFNRRNTLIYRKSVTPIEMR